LPTKITVAHAAPGLLAHFPDIVKLSDGRLLAAFRESKGHIKADGCIRLVESSDGGETWSEPWIAVDGEWDDRDPKLACLADGTVVLSYFVIDWSTKPRHSDYGTFTRRSTDGSVAELPGGDLLMPLYGRLPGREWHRATAVRSTDGGRTWPVGSEVLLGEMDGVHFQEPTLTVLDGEVAALIRTTAEVAYLTRSKDDGRTWSPAEPTDMPASSHHVLPLTTGELLITYGDLSHRFSQFRETVGRLVTRPLDTWDGYPDVQIYDSGHSDQANPSSVEIRPGRFLTLGFDIPAATVTGVFTEPADYMG
jgi:hypothetical protein